MPVDEILAPSYLRIKYRNPVVNKPHTLTLYFDGTITVDGDGVGTFTGFIDADHLTGWTVRDVVYELFQRFVNSSGDAPDFQFDAVEMWAAAEGDNLFLGFDEGDYSTHIEGAGTAQASVYFSYVYQTQQRRRTTHTFFEFGNSNPQQFTAVEPPVDDDDKPQWFVLKSAVLFSNSDGERLKHAVSGNRRSNTHAYKKYGKSINP